MTTAPERLPRGREARVVAAMPRMRRLLSEPLPPPRPGWETDAACGGEDPALFELLAAPGRGWTNVDAGLQDALRHQKAVVFCHRCPVKLDCRATALGEELVGTWGEERFTTLDWDAGRAVKKELGL